jgi:hypothetical protein
MAQLALDYSPSLATNVLSNMIHDVIQVTMLMPKLLGESCFCQKK